MEDLITVDSIFSLFSYSFVRNAFFVGILISFSFSFLSSFLVLKNCSLLGHGLSDVGFATFAIASALGASPVFVAVPAMILVSFFIFCFSQGKKNEGSTLIAIFSTTAMALGIVTASLNGGFNSGLYNYMFGSVFSLQYDDVVLSLILTTVVILVFLLFYSRIFLVMFDEDFAKARGFNVNFYKFLMSALVAVVTVLGIKMVGTLLVSSLMVFPAAISNRIAKSFKQLTFYSALFSCLSFIVGMLVSLGLGVPTGAAIVIINVILFFCVFIYKKLSNFKL